VKEGIDMRNTVAIPKQEVELSFTPNDWLNVVSYLKLSKVLDFNHLDVEFQPVTNSFWEYNPHVWLHMTSFQPPKERVTAIYSFLDNKQVPQHPDWIVLPEKVKLVVKQDISIQQLFEAISPYNLMYWLPDSRGDLFHLLPVLFREGTDQRRLQAKLNDILDSPAVAENSRIISTTVVDNRLGQKIKLEFIVTEFAGWQFVRLLSMKYNGAKFEHYVKDQANGNVYSADSTYLGSLKRDYYIVFTKSELFWACDQLMYEFMHHSPRRTLINEDMALHLRIYWHYRFHGQRKLNGEFAVFEPDYTTFIETPSPIGGAI
jgi:hypothetical protein